MGNNVKPRIWPAVLVFSLWVGCTAAAGRTIYVDADAPGANNGSSWADSYIHLQDGLADANCNPDVNEIRVAQGTYRPEPPNGSREVSFAIKTQIVIKGGYAGFGQADPDARDIQTYVTVLSGDLNGDDAAVSDPIDLADEPTRSENSYHVVTAHDEASTSEAVLDGFLITSGNANGEASVYARGGGVDANRSLIIRNCFIERNNARSFGGACSWVKEMDNCIVRNSYAPYGGGLWNVGRATSCVIERNVALTGGGLMPPYRFFPFPHGEYVGCVIRNNRAENGGGTYMYTDRQVVFRDCEFTGNEASESGGAIYIAVDCTCVSRLWLYQCWIHGNSAGEAGGGLFQNGNTHVELWSCVATGNYAGTKGGGICCELFGAMGDGTCNIYNCTIAQNTADTLGGGINCKADHPSQFHIMNGIIWGNQDESGLGTETAQIHFALTDPDEDTGYPSSETDPGIVDYCCIQGLTGALGGEGNIDANPLFVDPDGPDNVVGTEDDNLRLLPGSPCIDAGDPDYEPEPDETDLDGRPRIIGGRIDMGAYEFQPPRILHVDADAPGANDGSSWTNAYWHLQDALADADSSPKPVEIRVAQGTYRPDQGLGVTPGDRAATFQLIRLVAINGGYAGAGAPDPNTRDIELYETILSGDLNGDDAYVPEPPDLRLEPTRQENSRHVVVASETDATAVMDGFTITGANGARYGGGMANNNSSPTILNCTFRENSGNYDGEGAGMYNYASSPNLTNCAFIRNGASWPGGGGMRNNYGSSPTLTNCVFIGNTANSRAFEHGEGSGGAMVNWEYSNPTLINCLFFNNSASDDGGAIRNAANGVSRPVLVNCTFAGNSARRRGGAIFCDCGSDTTLTNCIFWSNAAPLGKVMYLYFYKYGYPSTVTVNYCDIEDGQDGLYVEEGCIVNWGNGNIDVDPLFADPTTGNLHLKSQAGRWDSDAQTWVEDAVTSPCIDGGDPMSPIGLEPFPNGGRINMGAYGGTPEASKSYFGQPLCQTIVTGDINGDCEVNLKDFALLALNWLRDQNL